MVDGYILELLPQEIGRCIGRAGKQNRTTPKNRDQTRANLYRSMTWRAHQDTYNPVFLCINAPSATFLLETGAR